MNREDIINRLQKIPTGNIADAMDILGIEGCALSHEIYPAYPVQGITAGYAVTISYVRKTEPGGEQTALADFNNVIDNIIEPGSIVIADVCAITDFSILGGLMALRAKIQGANGILINGAIRDIDELQNMDMPAFIAGTSPYKCRQQYIETAGINTDVKIAGARIRSGDYIVMDVSGVIVIPKERAEEIIEKASAIGERELRVENYLRAGMKLVDAKKAAV